MTGPTRIGPSRDCCTGLMAPSARTSVEQLAAIARQPAQMAAGVIVRRATFYDRRQGNCRCSFARRALSGL